MPSTMSRPRPEAAGDRRRLQRLVSLAPLRRREWLSRLTAARCRERCVPWPACGLRPLTWAWCRRYPELAAHLKVFVTVPRTAGTVTRVYAA